MSDAERFIAAIGALAESVKVFYDSLIAQGFEHNDALKMCNTFVESTLEVGGKK